MEDSLYRVIDPQGNFDERLEPRIPSDELREMYVRLVQVRMLDERMLILQRQGRIGFYVPSLGEEATQIGSAWTTKKDDWVFPSYREPGVGLVRGVPLNAFIAQVFGSSLDVNKGRQMPNHMGYRDANFVSPGSPVGVQIPHAVGAAWAMKLRKEPNACIVYFGDGATSGSDFHFSMNFAGVYKVPCVFLCKNNQWAISLPVSRQTASMSIAIKAMAYGFEGVRVDGNDVLAVYTVTKHALERARDGEGPTLIECVTYRMGPHSSSDDPSKYRDQAEVEEWKKRDPLNRFRLYLQAKDLWSEDWEASIRKEVEEELTAVIKEQENAPKPSLESLFTDVYAEMPWNLEEQMQETLNKAGKRKHEKGEDFPL